MKRRIGRFEIGMRCAQEIPGLGAILLEHCRVLGVDYELDDVVRYRALCDDFDEVEEGAEIPRYRAILRTQPDGSTSFVEWRKVDGL